MKNAKYSLLYKIGNDYYTERVVGTLAISEQVIADVMNNIITTGNIFPVRSIVWCLKTPLPAPREASSEVL